MRQAGVSGLVGIGGGSVWAAGWEAGARSLDAGEDGVGRVNLVGPGVHAQRRWGGGAAWRGVGAGWSEGQMEGGREGGMDGWMEWECTGGGSVGRWPMADG